MTGTPTSLSEAIANGMSIKHKDTYDLRENIQNHISDFLAQKFTKALLQMDQWRDGSSTKLTPEEILKQLWSEVI